MFSGHVGLDPYTTAVSDVYQDLFGEGSYVGKGIYDVDAFERALDGRVPDNALLSHDLFEGLFARVALCTDLEVIDDFPSHYLTWVARLHRWVRGDWQLLPWLGRTVPTQSGARVRNMLPAVARWKMADNLRRSLLPIALLVLLAAGWLVLPGGPSLWTGTAFLVLFFPAYVQWGQTFANRVRGVQLRGSHPIGARQPRVEPAPGAPPQRVSRASVVRHGRRHRAHCSCACTPGGILLEWETAADTAARLQGEWPLVLRRMWVAPVAALALAVAVIALQPSSALWALPVLTLWAISPYFAYRTGLPRQGDRQVLDAARAARAAPHGAG